MKSKRASEALRRLGVSLDACEVCRSDVLSRDSLWLYEVSGGLAAVTCSFACSRRVAKRRGDCTNLFTAPGDEPRVLLGVTARAPALAGAVSVAIDSCFAYTIVGLIRSIRERRSDA